MKNHVETVRSWVEFGWNRGDFSNIEKIYSPDYRLNDPALPEPVRGPAGLREFVSGFRASIGGMSVKVEQTFADGDQVAWRWRIEGSHDGPIFGIPATNKKLSVTGIILTRFDREGRWVEDHSQWDLHGMLRQMGVLPS